MSTLTACPRVQERFHVYEVAPGATQRSPMGSSFADVDDARLAAQTWRRDYPAYRFHVVKRTTITAEEDVDVDTD